MYPDKKNLLQLIALLKAHQIKHIVISPGSRNSALSHSFAIDPDFTCWPVTDERSAGFFAIGLTQQTHQPVAVCCTSGSALLNLGPAVAEAFYQPLPLLVISADRPASWIGQTDGQTLPQPGIFRDLVKKSVQLPEPVTAEDEWYCNRLINEALCALDHHGKGPVHINIPLSEPLSNYVINEIHPVRKINRYQPATSFSKEYANRFAHFRKPMIIVGQYQPDDCPEGLLKQLQRQSQCIILSEYLSNIQGPEIISNFDPLLYTLSEKEKKELAPDLLITFGGHLVSKRIKQLLRSFPPVEHWHITPAGEITDLFQSLTDIIEGSEEAFIHSLLEHLPADRQPEKNWSQNWFRRSACIPEPENNFSDMYAVKQLCHNIPENAALQLGNSSSVRYTQLFPLPHSTQVYCNRGTSGIEGSVSTATGYSANTNQLTFLLIGDLSFFYDMNGLWNEHIGSNLRILVNNNSGGEIFYALPGLNRSEALNPYIAGNHTTSAKGWAETRGFHYLKATNKEEVDKYMQQLTSPESSYPVLLEVFSDIDSNTAILRKYYHNIKSVVGR